ncbi:MAG: cytosine deaminase [Cyanobacteria bacterium J06621_11]
MTALPFSKACFQLPDADHYWLCNAQVPQVLLGDDLPGSFAANQDGLVVVDVEVADRQVLSIVPSGSIVPAGSNLSGGVHRASVPASVPNVQVNAGLLWPCFIDMHTHLDKGHMWARSPNPDGTFSGALETVKADSTARWQAEDVYRRAEFGLKCSYAHGTQAIRTHLDAFDDQAEISFGVFRRLRKAWADRMQLQAVCLVTLDYFLTLKGEQLADLVAESAGVLGGVAFMNNDIVRQIDRVFELAIERNLDLDFHTDESLDPTSITLRLVAEAAIRHQFAGRITCGHCCSLSVQSDEVVQRTIELVKSAGISIVSLPMCNLYLQDRQSGQPQAGGQLKASGQLKRTPRYRGVTLLRELAAAGIDCAIASDNCRDPFFAYGDHDGLEVFTQAVRIGHLDHPLGDWPQAITTTPAEMMGLGGSSENQSEKNRTGKIQVGSSADFVVFKARSFNELMARGQSDRVVIRKGAQIDTTLPDYSELDDLM